MKLATKPYTGTKDFIFHDFERISFIFEHWRRVCKQFGFNEYVLPILEPVDIYKAKSGEEIVNEQLYVLNDKGGRELAIRPEATPSITRVVAKYYNRVTKPIKVFSILNFMRYERPQSGRMREFFQLNVDIFGVDSLLADLQLINVALESILVFDPPDGSFIFFINDRYLMFEALDRLGIKDIQQQHLVLRFIDKLGKMSDSEFKKGLENLLNMVKGTLEGKGHIQLDEFLTLLYSTNFSELDLSKAMDMVPLFSKLKRTEYVAELLSELSAVSVYNKFVRFNPAIVRGLDYYDGIVFEAFDTHPQNSRALLGGGRYNGLGALFGVDNMPAIGFGAGNYTLENFLDNWDLWGKDRKRTIRIFVPLLKGVEASAVYNAMSDVKFRDKVIQEVKHIDNSIGDFEVAFDIGVKEYSIIAALRFANKLAYDFVLILGDKELQNNEINLKKL